MILVLDLEATCADDGSIPPKEMEIIEVGACWSTLDGQVVDQFQSFVRPVDRPTLTAFCMKLTHIEQFQINGALGWPEVSTKLAEFAQRYELVGDAWGSWGGYDARQIHRDCARHGILDPLAGLLHQNIEAQFAKNRHIKQVGLNTALQIVGLQLEGVHHRALDDVLNTARLLPWSGLAK